MNRKALVATILICLMLVVGVLMFPDADPTTENDEVGVTPKWASDMGIELDSNVSIAPGVTFFAIVDDASCLANIGLSDSENGDQLEIKILENDKWVIKDLRTNQEHEITYIVQQ